MEGEHPAMSGSRILYIASSPNEEASHSHQGIGRRLGFGPGLCVLRGRVLRELFLRIEFHLLYIFHQRILAVQQIVVYSYHVVDVGITLHLDM